MDYQGTRAGSGGSFWIDLLGQKGSKKDGRYTYFQIMVEATGQVPPEDLVVRAIRSSALGYKEGSGRALTHVGTGRPT